MRTRLSTNTTDRVELPEPAVAVTADGRILTDGGAASLDSAVEVTPLVQATTLTFGESAKSLALILTGSATKYLVRSLKITADTGNGAGDNIGVRKGALGVIFSVLAAGEYWEVKSPDGTVFDSNLLHVSSIQDTPTVVVFAFR